MIAVCGMACDVCKLLENEACEMGGCCPGTDESVPERQRRMKEELGTTCPILECAAKRGIDYCFKCPDFPCEVYYAQEMPERYASPGMKYKPFPYREEFLAKFKKLKDGKAK